MADAQETLKNLWLQSRSGTLSAREQAKAWALRGIWIEQNVGRTVARNKLTRTDLYGMIEFARQRVVTSGKGVAHPCGRCLRTLFAKIDGDQEWFPGKKDPDAATSGPAPVLQGAKRKAVAEAAMALKRRGVEPTYSKIVAQCPSAIINPATGLAVHADRVYKVIREDCYDKDPNAPWLHQPRVNKKGLTDAVIERRFNWGVHMLTKEYTPTWYYKNLVWTDICNTVLARSLKRRMRWY